MGTPQIPVSVEGCTYFGCCDMCKGKLERAARCFAGKEYELDVAR
jgi:hypothetical protein